METYAILISNFELTLKEVRERGKRQQQQQALTENLNRKISKELSMRYRSAMPLLLQRFVCDQFHKNSCLPRTMNMFNDTVTKLGTEAQSYKEKMDKRRKGMEKPEK